jgi:hypothetical protein
VYIEVHYEDKQDKKLAREAIDRLESDDSWVPSGVGDHPSIWIIDDEEPVNPEIPCNHHEDYVGTVSAGSIRGPHASAVTCRACVVKTKGWAQLMTGCPAGELLTFEEARKSHV